MARKGHQQRNGLDHNPSNRKISISSSEDGLSGKKERLEVCEGKFADGGKLPNGNQPSSPSTERVNKSKYVGDEKKNKQKNGKFLGKEKSGMDGMQGLVQSMPHGCNSEDHVENISAVDTSELRDNRTSLGSNHGSDYSKSSLGCSQNGLPTEDVMEGLGSSDTVVGRIGRSFGASALSILKTANRWLERQKPLFTTLTTIIFNTRDYVQLKTEQAYPIVRRWFVHFGNIMLLLSMVWLDCTLRGLDSFLRLGTTSFFSVIWCSILSVIAMIGISKFLMVMALAALVGFFVGFTLAVLVIAFSATVFLWLYGSFWTTGLVIFVGGLAFSLSHERLALLITTVYSIYCARTYVGWLGLLLGLNLSFISSDALIYFLKNNMSEHSRSRSSPEQTASMRGRPGSFYGEPVHASPSEPASGRSTDRSPGVPSTSGADAELTSEDEVVRLLNCSDHYSALGLSRFENVDVSLLKREYRKKAMLVHPDKNMGNEKAAEAFKKLQNAYEVLLDSLKRKAYDDELRREELLNYFRRFQSSSQKNGRNGFFASGFKNSEADGEDPLGDSRRIACKKCGNFHMWIHTKKSKSQARWCQDCKEFHQAKDGDGWVEQSFQPFFFGLLQKVEAPSAYVCAESRIYDATEWFICQGMKCLANTHKPSFHVNTSVTSKHSNVKGTGLGQRGGMPASNLEESMTEEEFFEWLQNAVQSGMFDTAGGSPSTESPPARAGSFSKNSGSSSSSSKRKKKGKKQW
ncbi:hypothetical protein HHK36_020922 [Tetracentron sinense]|uniref:J domain-containing protein n=1 Tax=Tetracentron sinense TaxID=13715 RepID=A0A834YW07_TETSI|nr:hypothetical protein HHK36_020922 [Tetracentron sinense]